uniref:oligopeptidase A n=1 Tax=Bicosoecida sp. CB-2014 TaxID=1486930 RepID=A0A7S1CT29_9STRA
MAAAFRAGVMCAQVSGAAPGRVLKALARAPQARAAVWRRSSGVRRSSALLDASPAGLPRFGAIKAEDVVPAVTTALEEFQTGVAALNARFGGAAGDGGRAAPTVAEAAELTDAIERLYDPLSRVWGAVSHLNGVAQTPELRAAYEEVQPRVTEALTRFSQSVFPALAAVRDAPGVLDGLDGARRRVVELNVLSAELAGAGLPEAEREALTALKVGVGAAGSRFTNNVMDAVTPQAFALDLADAADVAGMPRSVRAAAAHAHEDEAATADAGPWRFTLDASSFMPFMRHCRRRELREHMYRSYVAIASTGDRDNQPIIREILAKRRQVAALLGYPNYAEVSIAPKMAPDAATVVALLERLRDKCYDAARTELARLHAFAVDGGYDGGDALALWDVPFWSERQLEATFALGDDVLQPYFSLPRVLAGMFATVERVFGVRVVAADGDAEVWHPDVRFFHVEAAGSGERVASFFLDPYARPGSKRGGAWMDVCVSRSSVVGEGLRLPVAYLVCNQSPPVGGGDALMRFAEVETLWHEFGHGLQHMLSEVDVGLVSGTSGVEWDAVELPSQFMENWCYHPPTLRAMTAHVETGEPLPNALIANLRASRVHNAAMAMLRQLFLARLDLALHMAPAEADADAAAATLDDPFAVVHDVAARYTLTRPLHEDRFLCQFMHIFSASYAAGYYSYKWAEVLSADAFAAFEEAGLDDDAAVREAGDRFRRTVLARGGAQHATEVYRAFRGRDASEDALLAAYGLQSHAAAPSASASVSV